MKRRWSKFDLQNKARVIACLGLAIWLLSFFIMFIEIERINKATIGLEHVEDLYDTILEMRRYEKNFLLYQGQENRNQILNLFKKARDIYEKMTATPSMVSGIKTKSQWPDAFTEYGIAAGIFKDPVLKKISNKNDQARIRLAGRRLVELSFDLLKKSRTHIARTTHNAIRIPLIAAGMILGLFFVGWILLSRKVINPLIKLEQATKKIGHGDFSPISHPGKIESEVDRLVLAFNRMIEELDARQEQIVHDRKIASLGTLVSGVAHELNNPINNIILTVDVLAGGRKIKKERQAAMLKDILNQAIRASGIVKNLLDFSRAETSVIQDVDVNKVLDEILKITDNELSLKKIKLQRQSASDLPEIRGNHQELQQVFLNLVVNAIHAMKRGGELSIRTFHDDGGRVIVSVRDTGEGIPEDIMPNIFDPFFTTKEIGKGTGLGLSVSFGIVKKHGGRITVKSSMEKGTIFKVTLPAKEEMIYE
ncbi:MAG: HAMP domain-containing histidine kinase [Deltaproteobacteria bacterium]|nr:HAMP domain-containing histidine kinase [Deltaproteobacteria bacterium]